MIDGDAPTASLRSGSRVRLCQCRLMIDLISTEESSKVLTILSGSKDMLLSFVDVGRSRLGLSRGLSCMHVSRHYLDIPSEGSVSVSLSIV